MEKSLVFAAANGDAKKVAELLSQGGRVDARDQGFTPLLVAVQFGQTEVCEKAKPILRRQRQLETMH